MKQTILSCMMALAVYANPHFTDCDPVTDKTMGEFMPVKMLN